MTFTLTTRRLNSWVLGPALMAVAHSPARTQTNNGAEVRRALARQDMAGALRAARAAATQSSEDQYVFGVLLLAAGRPYEALTCLQSAANGVSRKPYVSGLEGFSYPGSALFRALNQQKVTLSLGGGQGAVRNNIGAAKILVNRATEALDELDAAVVADPEAGVPWANAAVAWLEKDRYRRAEDCAQKAIDHREATARVYTCLAEAAIKQQKWDRARSMLKRAEELDPDYPFALLVRSRLALQSGQSRDAERALVQALAGAPEVAAEGRYVGSRNEINAAGGNQSNDHYRLRSSGQPASVVFRGSLLRDAGAVDGRSDAYQRREFSEAILSRRSLRGDTTVYSAFEGEGGHRPGPFISATGASGFPQAVFGFNGTTASLLQSAELGRGGRIWMDVTYRHYGVSLRSTSESVDFRAIRDEQLAAEGRWDLTLSPHTRLQSGFAWTQNDRASQSAPAGDILATSPHPFPMEPNEQLLPSGTTTMATGYLIARHILSSRASLSLGPVYGRADETAFLLPFFDLRFRTASRQTIGLSILPRSVNANADLAPIRSLGESWWVNDLRRRDVSVDAHNGSPVLPGLTGRELRYEASYASQGSRGSLLEVTAFHRRISDSFTLSDDPRLSPVLNLTPLIHGESNGIEARAEASLPHGFSVGLFSRYQESRGDTGITALNADTLISHFPRWQNTFTIGWSAPSGWSGAVETVHFGSRSVMETGGRDGPSTARLRDAVGVNVHVRGRISNSTSLFFSVFSLGQAHFFRTYPSRPTVLVGLDSHL